MSGKPSVVRAWSIDPTLPHLDFPKLRCPYDYPSDDNVNETVSVKTSDSKWYPNSDRLA